jgi:hypothetical protein
MDMHVAYPARVDLVHTESSKTGWVSAFHGAADSRRRDSTADGSVCANNSLQAQINEGCIALIDSIS